MTTTAATDHLRVLWLIRSLGPITGPDLADWSGVVSHAARQELATVLADLYRRGLITVIAGKPEQIDVTEWGRQRCPAAVLPETEPKPPRTGVVARLRRVVGM